MRWADDPVNKGFPIHWVLTNAAVCTVAADDIRLDSSVVLQTATEPVCPFIVDILNHPSYNLKFLLTASGWLNRVDGQQAYPFGQDPGSER